MTFRLSPPDGFSGHPPVILQTIDLYKLVHICVIGFPKIEKLGLGQQIQETALRFLQILLRANADKQQRRLSLQEASILLDQLKILIRIAWEISIISHKRHAQLIAQLQPIGQMLGGWLKSEK